MLPFFVFLVITHLLLAQYYKWNKHEKKVLTMKEWYDVKSTINSLNSDEKETLDFVVNLVSQIINRRLELGLTQSELANKCGLKQSAIARVESNGAIPRTDTLFKILRALDLTIELRPIKND